MIVADPKWLLTILVNFTTAFLSANFTTPTGKKCCARLLRDIKPILDNKIPENPDAKAFLKALKKVIQDAISLHRQHFILTAEEYFSDRKAILKRFRTLYLHPPL
jgi:hypothetical protein